MSSQPTSTILFSLEPHPLHSLLCEKLAVTHGYLHSRRFPDEESYLCVDTHVKGSHCIVLADLSHPDPKCLPLLFLVETLREMGAASVGLVAPYLSYMRQDKRFAKGEAVTSRIFAELLSHYVDWLVTVDPHLHRYHSLGEIYSIPRRVVHGASLLAHWLVSQQNVLLVGPDEESRQWVSEVSKRCGHPFVVGEKQRMGDREVSVTLPQLTSFNSRSAVIIDDVISSGQTLIKCIDALHEQGIEQVACAAIHGIFADDADSKLLAKGITQLVTTNSIPHYSNLLDLSDILLAPINECLEIQEDLKEGG